MIIEGRGACGGGYIMLECRMNAFPVTEFSGRDFSALFHHKIETYFHYKRYVG